MSYPNVIYGDYGDEKKTAGSASGGIGSLPLGQLMILPDGRKFRHARATSGSTLAAGKLTIQHAATAGHGNVAASGMVTAAQTVAIGDRSIIVTCATAVTVDQYANGYLTVQSGTGLGLVYKIKSHNAADAAATTTIQFADNDKIAATIAAGTTTVGLRTSPYDRVTIRAAAPSAVGVVTGVPPVEVTASKYFWVQRSGECAGLVGGTMLVAGDPVVASTSVAGAFVPLVPITAAGTTVNTTEDYDVFGHAQNTVTAGEYASIYLTLE